MQWDHKFFRDAQGIVHETDGTMGQASSMLCEERDNFRLKMDELVPVDPPVTCLACARR